MSIEIMFNNQNDLQELTERRDISYIEFDEMNIPVVVYLPQISVDYAVN